MTEKNRHITLFKDKPKKTVDNKVFDMMNKSVVGKDKHLALAMAGMAPGPTGFAADILDTALYAKEGDWSGFGWSLLAAVPLIGAIGSVKKFKNIKNVLSDTKLIKSNSFEGKVNRAISNLGSGKFNKLGKTKNPYNNKKLDIYISDDVIRINNKRDVRVVRIVGEDGADWFQPFYKSTGRGEPSLKSKGKWFPFEGILPRGHKMEMLYALKDKKIQSSFVKGKDAIFRSELGPGDMPTGWFIKGWKSPKEGYYGKVFSSGQKKEGLQIHTIIGKMLSEYKQP